MLWLSESVIQDTQNLAGMDLPPLLPHCYGPSLDILSMGVIFSVHTNKWTI